MGCLASRTMTAEELSQREDGRERKRKMIGRAVEGLLRVPAYFAPLLRLIFIRIALMCAFRLPAGSHNRFV